MNDNSVTVLQSTPNEFAGLSEKIVRYVARTQETVVLNDAAIEGNFTDDAYIQQHQCKSVACTPLINQNKLQGIIYLENNLRAGAFSEERMALLRHPRRPRSDFFGKCPTVRRLQPLCTEAVSQFFREKEYCRCGIGRSRRKRNDSSLLRYPRLYNHL